MALAVDLPIVAGFEYSLLWWVVTDGVKDGLPAHSALGVVGAWDGIEPVSGALRGFAGAIGPLIFDEADALAFSCGAGAVRAVERAVRDGRAVARWRWWLLEL
jgi:hypothetical protein